MRSLKSNILVIGYQNDFTLSLELEHCKDFHDAIKIINENNFTIIVINCSVFTSKEILKIFKQIENTTPETQKIIIEKNTSLQLISKIINTFGIAHIIPFPSTDIESINSFNSELKQELEHSLETYTQLKQNNQLFDLVNEQNKKLEDLSIILDKKIQKRQRYLTTSKEKLLKTNSQIEALHRALIVIQKATSISELETLLLQALESSMNLAWIRILFQTQSLFEEQEVINNQLLLQRDQKNTSDNLDIFSSPIVLDNIHAGQIYFARKNNEKFSKEDNNFLLQITDAVLLSINRLSRLENAQDLKQQWESTFDAISNPLSLINSDYEIIRCNQAFAKKTNKDIKDIIGKKCHESLFGQKQPCLSCPSKRNFYLPQKKTLSNDYFSFEVTKQKLDLPSYQSNLYVVFYHDKTEQKKLEQQFLESAKMAELGTISSSIAHELNNPLGGIISFLQLIKMDLPKASPYFDDIDEMEQGALKCKDIVQDLLSYSRKQSTDQLTKIDLRSVIRKSIKMSSIEFKTKPINIRCDFPKHPVIIDGQLNVLTQSIQHFIQSLAEINLNNGDQNNTTITLNLTTDSEAFILSIDTSFICSEKEVKENFHSLGLNYQITSQIIAEHTGNLEFFSQTNKPLLIKITFPRPEID